jgi:hypothetical protein
VMNIFVPFTRLQVETVLAVPDARFVPMTDETAYSRFFIDRWKEGRTFIVVEHDVVPPRARLEEMWACRHPWCVNTYREGHSDRSPYLGCAKISAEFIRLHPGLWVERPWGNCDCFLVERAKFFSHWHGVVKHLH